MIFLFDQFNFGKSESKLALIAKHLFCFYVFFSGGCLDIDNLDPDSRLFWSLVCVRAEGGPGAIFLEEKLNIENGSLSFRVSLML